MESSFSKNAKGDSDHRQKGCLHEFEKFAAQLKTSQTSQETHSQFTPSFHFNLECYVVGFEYFELHMLRYYLEVFG